MPAGNGGAPSSSPWVDVRWLQGFSDDENSTGGSGGSYLISQTPLITSKIIKNSDSVACWGFSFVGRNSGSTDAYLLGFLYLHVADVET
jgi:hypothetical protein